MEELKQVAKPTFTRNIAEIINKNYVKITKVEYFYTSKSDRAPVDKDTFVKSLLALNKSGIFSDSPDWKYEEAHYYSDTEGFVLFGQVHDHYQVRFILVNLVLQDRYEIEDVVKIFRKS